MELDLDKLPVPIIHGKGAVSRLGEVAAECGGSRPLLVTDRGIASAGHLGPAVASLEATGLVVAVFDQVHENPTSADVHACVAAAREHEADMLIGMGGGSSMDAAKGCNFIYTNGGEMEDYWGIDKATEPMLPFIAVPTTAGTGSECQRFALISNPETHTKMACGDIKTRARAAILDPLLTLTQPPFVAACTGVDAVAHAVETAVTTKRNPESFLYSREAFRRLVGNLPIVIGDPGNVEARAEVQLGAALAGAAIEHSMLGAAHAAANPLTAHFGTVHGQAVGNMLPHVVRFNSLDPEVAAGYDRLTEVGRLEPGSLASWLEELLEKTGLHASLDELSEGEADITALSEEAAQQWTGTFNPRPVEAEDFIALYEEATRC